MTLHAKALLLSFLLASPVLAQNTFYKSFTLPAETTTPVINALYQDKKGYILVGATSGLYRFDGIAFYKFQKDQGVPDDVTAICETKDGITWVGFSDGKLAWLRKNQLILQNPEEGFPSKSIKKIIQDAAGVVWIATAGEGIYYFSNNRFYNINTDDGLSDNYVYDIIPDASGIVAATDQGINFCSVKGGKKITRLTSANGLLDNIVRCLYKHEGNVYYGTQDGGVGILFKENGNTNSTVANNNWPKGTVNALLVAGETLWAGFNNGVYQAGFPAIAGHTKLPGSLSKTIDFTASQFLADAEGNVWAAGNNQLIRTNGTKLLPVVSLQQDEAPNVHTLLIDKDSHLWFNVSKGLKHMERDVNGNWIERLFQLPVSINSQITTLYEDKFENIWIGTMGSGAFLLDARTGKFRKITESSLLSTASVLSITGKDNQVWIASLEGAVQCVLKENNGNIYQPLAMAEFTAISGIGTNYIYNIFVDSKNRTWFATDGKGIVRYENGKLTRYDHRNGLESDVVYQVTEDKKGNIWFTTFNEGIGRFDGNKFRYFTNTDGLSDMGATSMATDKDGNIYLSHKNGIDIVHSSSNTFTYIDAEQGLSAVNTDMNTITTCKEGDVYFVANNSIYKYRPSLVNVQPKVIIDRVQLFLNDIDVEDGHVFESSEDNISFYYTGLYYSQPQKIQYQYKLEGFGDEWITTNDRRRDFPKLAPGTYTFRVRASLNKNFENAPETSFTFTIQKPLWLRWWFIILFFTVIGILLYWYIKGREKRLQQLERLEKEKIQSQFETLRNQVNPHFLFNSFNTLISEIEDDPKKAVEYVEHMADFFRSIVTYREKDVISLGEEIHIVQDYLFIQRKRYGNAFLVNINISSEEEQQYYLAPLTLQLLAENAIKHNAILREKPLALDIFIEAGQLIVRNNINPKLHPEKSAGLGLQNIQKRYELLTKKSVIISNDDEFFTVIIPLIKRSNDTDTDYRR